MPHLLGIVPHHPLLDQLGPCLNRIVAAREVRLTGQWSTSSRRTYASEVSSRAASGAFVDVLDQRWHGSLLSEGAVGAIAFLLHHGDLYWAKSPEISSTLPVEVSLHSYADFQHDRATLATSVGGGWLPGVPVSHTGPAAAASIIADEIVETGRVTGIARVTDTVLFVILLPAELLEMGRKRVWHLRDAAPFDSVPRLREILTRGRSGTIPADVGTVRDGR